MDTLQQSAPRLAPLRGVELVGYSLVALGFGLMILGILEIGGLFNLCLGLIAVQIGIVMIFGGETSGGLDEAAFRRELEQL